MTSQGQAHSGAPRAHRHHPAGKSRGLLLPVILWSLGTSCDSPAAIDPVALEHVVAELSAVDGMKAFLVQQRGVLLVEEYFNGQTADSLHEVRSVTKSVTSALIGIAIAEGAIGSVHDRMVDYLQGVTAELDPALEAITIEDLLTMRAGHDWHQIPGPSEFNTWILSPDQIDYILEKPLVHDPGTRFNYSDGAAHLAAVVLAEATGMSASAYAAARLWEPLGIPERPWYTDNRGYNFGGVGLQVRARDMLAFGALYLNGGRHADRQIVPARWVDESTAARVSTNDAVPYGPAYGYYWWSGSYDGRSFYYANGYGGQFIVVVPELEMVVVATCAWRSTAGNASEHWYRIITAIVTELLPATQ